MPGAAPLRMDHSGSSGGSSREMSISRGGGREARARTLCVRSAASREQAAPRRRGGVGQMPNRTGAAHHDTSVWHEASDARGGRHVLNRWREIHLGIGGNVQVVSDDIDGRLPSTRGGSAFRLSGATRKSHIDHRISPATSSGVCPPILDAQQPKNSLLPATARVSMQRALDPWRVWNSKYGTIRQHHTDTEARRSHDRDRRTHARAASAFTM